MSQAFDLSQVIAGQIIMVEDLSVPKRPSVWLLRVVRFDNQLVYRPLFETLAGGDTSRVTRFELIDIRPAQTKDRDDSGYMVYAGDTLHLRAHDETDSYVTVSSLYLDYRPVIERKLTCRIWIGVTAYAVELSDNLHHYDEMDYCDLTWRLDRSRRIDGRPLPYADILVLPSEDGWLPRRITEAIVQARLTDYVYSEPVYLLYEDAGQGCRAKLVALDVPDLEAWRLTVAAPDIASVLAYRQRVLSNQATPVPPGSATS